MRSAAVLLVAFAVSARAFVPVAAGVATRRRPGAAATADSTDRRLRRRRPGALWSSTDDEAAEATEATPAAAQPTEAAEATRAGLDAKMAKWDATEEEVKAATLGGITPNSSGAFDSFDLGLYIAFPIMFATLAFFGLFPVIMDNIDVTSVGPPPMV